MNTISTARNSVLPVNEGRKKLKLPARQIKFVCSCRAYSAIFMLDGKQHIKPWNLNRVDAFLKPAGIFFRSHKTRLVNICCINWQESPGKKWLLMADGTQHPLARRAEKHFKKLRRKMTAGEIAVV